MSGNLRLLADTLARARREDRAALIAGTTAGFPTVDDGIVASQAMLNAGADIIEIGLPHSDPVLDGPVIQAAADSALRGGTRIADVIRTVRETYEATGKPVLVMSYWNPIDRYGAERFSGELAEAGGAGCILPDLPVQESARWRDSAARHCLATVFVAAPSTTDQRLRELAEAGTGFIYASSLMGVTGVRDSLNATAGSLVRRIRAMSDLPVCVGIGISDAVQAAEAAGFGDGVIVASALVKAVMDAPDAAAGIAAAAELTAGLSRATRRDVPASGTSRIEPVRLDVGDAGEVLTLQRAAYVTEAQAHGDLSMPPLLQTLKELRAELAAPEVSAWGIREAGRLVASVRVRMADPAVAEVGRLIVAPDRQGNGLGSALLLAAESRLPDEVTVIRLFTGEHSTANLRLYQRLGYRERRRSSAGAYELVHLAKSRGQRGASPMR